MRQNKFIVSTEDHSDFYKDPPIRPVIGEFDTYDEAVVCAKEWVESNLDTLKDDPACCYIAPEPDSKHFDSHVYEDELRNRIDEKSNHK